MLVLVIASPSLGQQSLVGIYKLVSHELQVNGTAMQPVGKAPHGYLVFTPTHFIYFYTADNRKFGTSVADKAALLDTLVGYGGTYRVDGGKIIQTVDASWTEAWNGKVLGRNWALSGNRLTLTGDPEPFPRDPSKTSIVRVVWEKIE